MEENEIRMQSGRELPSEWVVELESQLPKTADEHVRKKNTIYKIPDRFVNPNFIDAYKPQIVSFGPYHHGEARLRPMEEHKRRALRHYLDKTDRTLKDYMARLWPELQKLMGYYKDLDEYWSENPKRFLQLMVVDGWFMLRILETKGNSPPANFEKDDPTFGNHSLLYNIPLFKRDMLMVGNQIPLLVLKKLLEVEQGEKQVSETQEEKQVAQSLDRIVNNSVLLFFELTPAKPENRVSIKCTTDQVLCCFNQAPQTPTEGETPSELGLHVLDLVRKSMVKGIDNKSEEIFEEASSASQRSDVIWPATQLQEAGIKFMKSETRNLLDVEFDDKYSFLFRRGILSLPEISVDDCTKSKFLNLMAFERLHADAGNEVSSYVCFMNNIIDSEKDVSLLSQSDIIKNFVGTDQEVAQLFNGLSLDVPNDKKSKLFKKQQRVIDYCNGFCNRSCANLKHTHFRSPWSGIALFAASVVLCITIIQFVYSVLSYYLHDG